MTSYIAVCAFVIITLSNIYDVSSQRKKSGGCVLQDVPGQINSYKIHLNAIGYKSFYCANGTIFSKELCGCINYVPVDNAPMPTAPALTEPQKDPNIIGIEGTADPYQPISPCLRFSPDADKAFYWEANPGHRSRRRPCARGTLFNSDSCMCDVMAPVSNRVCRPNMMLNFDGRFIRDVAGTSIYVHNSGVDIIKNHGRFNRQGVLTIPRYSNPDFRDALTIELRFYDFRGGDNEQVLISNCIDKSPGTVEIVTSFVNKTVKFRLQTVTDEPKELTFKYGSGWKNVALVYDGKMFTGVVNKQRKFVDTSGYISNSLAGFSIGQCTIFKPYKRAFVGYIDDLKISKCVKKKYTIQPMV